MARKFARFAEGRGASDVRPRSAGMSFVNKVLVALTRGGLPLKRHSASWKEQINAFQLSAAELRNFLADPVGFLTLLGRKLLALGFCHIAKFLF
jgi:hypothetical protein